MKANKIVSDLSRMLDHISLKLVGHFHYAHEYRKKMGRVYGARDNLLPPTILGWFDIISGWLQIRYFPKTGWKQNIDYWYKVFTIS